MAAPVLGIDFGTTNSVCAVQIGNDTEVLQNASGSSITPSVVYYTQDHEQNRPLVGEQAENKARQNPERVIRSIKRLMGESDTITVDDIEHNVPEIASEILRKIRTDAANALDIDRDELTDVVITRPAYWEEDRTNAIHQAAEIAGFTSVRLIKEPAAAAIAYGQYRPDIDKTIGVYDLGGGTFDFAIVDVSIESPTSGTTGTGREEYSVIAQSGDPQLGGDDWDERVVEWVRDWVVSEYGVDPFEPLPNDNNEFEHMVRRERVRAKSRQAKESLSGATTTEVDINIPFFMEVDGETVSIERTLTESEFRSMTRDLTERTIEPMYTALNDANVSKHDLDEVILVGGSTKMPQIQEIIHAELEVKPTYDVDPSEAVAVGASIHGNRDDILLLEVTPLSLGIGIKGDRFKRMVERNTRLPAKRTEVFTPSQDGQTAVRIPVYQGEREIASENRHLKTLILEGLTPSSSQSAQIKVTFKVQKNGIINVHAVENTDNRSVSVEIEGENRLPDEYVNEKIKEAREMEEMDKRRQRVIEAQNEAESSIKDARRVLDRYPHIIDDDEERNIRNHISRVEYVRGDETATVSDLREAAHELNEWVLEVGDRARQQGVTPQTGPKEAPEVTVSDTSGRETQATGPTDKPESADDIQTGEQWGEDDAIQTESIENTSDSSAESNGSEDTVVDHEEHADDAEDDEDDDGDDVETLASGVMEPGPDDTDGEQTEFTDDDFSAFDDNDENKDDTSDTPESQQQDTYNQDGDGETSDPGDEDTSKQDEPETETETDTPQSESSRDDESVDDEQDGEEDNEGDGGGEIISPDPDETTQGTLSDDTEPENSQPEPVTVSTGKDDEEDDDGKTKQTALKEMSFDEADNE